MVMSATLKREVLCFIIAGIIATFTDFIIYWNLHFYLAYSTAKTISFICGSVVAYLLNKFITFKKQGRSTTEIINFALLYAFAMMANVGTNSLSIFLLPMFLPLSSKMVVVLAFLMATGVGTVISFIGQRLWVFKTVTQ